MENRKMQALDDRMLEGITGGARGGDQMKTVELSKFCTSDLQYYLMGFCPKCKTNGLKACGGSTFGCDKCFIAYIQ